MDTDLVRNAELSLDLLFKINSLVAADVYQELSGYDKARILLVAISNLAEELKNEGLRTEAMRLIVRCHTEGAHGKK